MGKALNRIAFVFEWLNR